MKKPKVWLLYIDFFFINHEKADFISWGISELDLLNSKKRFQ